jgi:hypothetical protein
MRTLLINRTQLPTGETIFWEGKMPKHSVYAMDNDLLTSWKLYITNQLKCFNL